MTEVAIRPARGDDVAAIDGLFLRTFPAPEEARLVRELCVDGDMVLILVAEDDDAEIVGAITFSRMRVEVDGKAVPAVALAPVAVDGAMRRQGIAEALIQAGLDRLEQESVVLCFVLGDPAYYARFGFAVDVARGYETPYAGDYLMALPLQGGLIPCGVRGRADHAAAFARLGQAE